MLCRIVHGVQRPRRELCQAPTMASHLASQSSCWVLPVFEWQGGQGPLQPCSVSAMRWCEHFRILRCLGVLSGMWC